MVNGKEVHIQVASSTDLQHWKLEDDALPPKPLWADHDFWAPHVLYDSTLKKHVLFYSGESKDGHIGKCLGVAFPDRPEGPFTDKGTPLLCGEGFLDIDPFAFIDPKTGKRLLYWGCAFQPIKVQELTSDWGNFKHRTTPKPLVYPGKENHYDKLIEGAGGDCHDGKYYLYCRHWSPISLVSKKGRDVDNAASIQLPDHTILPGAHSVRWQQSYRLPVYRSTDNGLT